MLEKRRAPPAGLGGPATLAPGTMLLILALLVFVPCLALLISFLLSPGGKSGGNKKNDGVKVSSAPVPCAARPGAAGAVLGVSVRCRR